MAEVQDVNNLKPTQEGGGLSLDAAANLLSQVSQAPIDSGGELSNEVETVEETVIDDNSEQQLETEDNYEEESEEVIEDSVDMEEEEGDLEGFDFDGEFASVEQLKEWRDSGLRQEDYTRKTQEVAEIKTQLTQQVEQQVEVLKQQKEALDQYVHLVAAQMELEPHTNEHLQLIKEQEGIEAYLEARDSMEQRRNYLQQVFMQQQQAQEQLQQQEAVLKQERQAEAFKVISESIPEYADPEKGQPLRDGVAEMLKSDFGFTQESLNDLDDPKYFLVAHELWAMKQQETPAKVKQSIAKKKAKRSVSPVNKGGSPTSKRQRATQAQQQQMNAAMQAGSVEAATAALNALTKGER
jgi:hypothetical protein